MSEFRADGEFADDVARGQGTFLSASGASYSGSWQDGKPCGRGVETSAKGGDWRGEWVQGVPLLPGGSPPKRGDAFTQEHIAEHSIA